MGKYATSFAVAVLVALLIAFVPFVAVSTAEKTARGEVPEEEVKEETKETLNPVLVPICACESVGRKDGIPTHYEADGVTVRRGRQNPNDIGVCQINTEPRNGHVEAAARLGLDLWDEQGNISYANWLYEQSGLQPWSWSRSCWE